jgi:hypothetical protein
MALDAGSTAKQSAVHFATDVASIAEAFRAQHPRGPRFYETPVLGAGFTTVAARNISSGVEAPERNTGRSYGSSHGLITPMPVPA